MNTISRPLVLIVEDELFVRLVAIDALADEGFEVIDAEHASDALLLLENGSKPHLLFTDVHMPGDMNGIDLAERVRAMHPAVKVIVTSALPLVRKIDHLDAAFLAKPYHLGQLCGIARELMAA
jgi:CheY-like chemotaxis protein